VRGGQAGRGTRAELETALRVAHETSHTYEQAYTHRDLAESYHRAGEFGQARRHWQQATNRYTELGEPEADQIRARPSELGGGLVHEDRE
jgi:hypothetical protein